MTSVPEERVVIRDVDWAFYERLVDSIPPGSISMPLMTGRM
jgi:hypothetical protein